MGQLVAFETIRRSIISLRGHRVMLSAELAVLYGVEHRALVQAVGRNRSRFPEDFVFRLTRDEARKLRPQIVNSRANSGRGRGRHSKYPPYAPASDAATKQIGFRR